MTSILKVDSIQNSAGTVIMPVMAGGIIQTQVHQEFGQADFGVAGTAGDDALMNAARASDSSTKVEVAITPTSASSKILVTVNLFYEWSGSGNEHELLFLLYRGATRLGAPRQGNRRGGISPVTISYTENDYNSTPASAHFQYYDTPNSTSALTYTVAFNCSVTGSDYVRLNASVGATNSIAFEDGMSIITVQEIAQ